MKIKRNNKSEIINLITILLFIIVCTYLFIRTKNYLVLSLLFIIELYFIIILFKGIGVLKKSQIRLFNDYIYVGYLNKIDKNNLNDRLLSPFIKGTDHYGLKSYIIKLDDIKKIGFTKDLGINFKNATKFDIGIISKDKNKYLIPMKQYQESDIINLMKEISKKITLTGDINNIVK